MPDESTGPAAGSLPDDHTVSEQSTPAPIPDQVVTVRARPAATQLGMVVQRRGGGYECEELVPRHAREITLAAGDQLMVVPLQGSYAEEFLRLSKSEPAADTDPER
jgi:hypothetical protein